MIKNKYAKIVALCLASAMMLTSCGGCSSSDPEPQAVQQPDKPAQQPAANTGDGSQSGEEAQDRKSVV